MGEIAVLHHDEGIRVDGRRVVELYDELGAASAERVIGRAAEELAVALQFVVDQGRLALAAWGRTDPGAKARAAAIQRADRMAALAWQVGLASVGRVAGDLAVCAARDDAAGFAAVLARLDRVANRSLTAVWDAQDMRR